MKFDGDVGILHRKRLSADRIIYIGKEANKIDETIFLGVDDKDYETYIPEDKKKEWKTEDLYSVSLNDAWKLGISRSTLQRWRKNEHIHGITIDL